MFYCLFDYKAQIPRLANRAWGLAEHIHDQFGTEASRLTHDLDKLYGLTADELSTSSQSSGKNLVWPENSGLKQGTAEKMKFSL